eukprot:CAMPEP_0180667872 /NCGR_PEP_ID=MMETSP1037_2-20121125/62615_1 /TAXON_ID=632150 /ORGANISM="Azadinium spinosum, Strain 3D9" /LENGTH=71 /DNA_ID=CAMNT_0022696547 /DNA_START=6 /DNA_END=221 /DNA_ORIENTATION=+
MASRWREGIESGKDQLQPLHGVPLPEKLPIKEHLGGRVQTLPCHLVVYAVTALKAEPTLLHIIQLLMLQII